ncbi:unnamed protein product [Triticum aestivum]|uniref:NB-ARC domain-containing protein n=2 Tax=Triticum aestivum TaxID=4565 RepID=A0A9R1F143_WHEAT|nr:hypothetical protein CFC21_032913 [Triticum aestivum]SPT21002.1 unnamed protein product [Triticum aestivum]
MEHLEELSLSDSSRMSSKLSINNCPKLRMGPLLPRAVRSLRIERSDNVLSSWGECTMSSTGASSSSSSSVLLTTATSLTVVDSELPMQQWRPLRHLSGLENLYITSCSDLTVSPDIIPHLSSVERLFINRCDISSLPHWVMDLTGPEHLWIGGCEGIRSLPEGIQQLPKLRILRISRCPGLKKWSESEENKMKLAHIEIKDFD